MKEAKNSETIKELEEKVQELTTNWKRALADYQNLEKRASNQSEEVRDFTTCVMLLKLLPIFDNLVKASDLIKDNGLELVTKQFKDFLDNYQVKKFGEVGDSFDPTRYEAVAIDEEALDNKITEVFSPGYLIKDKLLRPAAVKVGRK